LRLYLVPLPGNVEPAPTHGPSPSTYDRLQADLFHIDAVLKNYGLTPDEIPTKGRMPRRSTYFGRNEISRRCRDTLRELGTIAADDVTVRAMREKGLDPESDRKLRADFSQRILVTLHDMVKRGGSVEKIGDKRGVRWPVLDLSTGDAGGRTMLVKMPI
jgi:hypothetical protein